VDSRRAPANAVDRDLFSPTGINTENGLSKRVVAVIPVIHTTYELRKVLKEHE
jgi:hypothetical protein